MNVGSSRKCLWVFILPLLLVLPVFTDDSEADLFQQVFGRGDDPPDQPISVLVIVSGRGKGQVVMLLTKKRTGSAHREGFLVGRW